MILEIMFFYIFQMVIGQHVELLKGQFYMLTRLGGMRNITMPNFFKTGLSKAEILRFFRFLLRDSYAKRGICCRRVCVPVTLRYCIKTARHRITQIMPHDSPETLVVF